MDSNNPDFIFIIGASGSGTTLFLKIFSELKHTLVFGGNHNNISKEDKELFYIKKKIDVLTSVLWDRVADHNRWHQTKAEFSGIVNNISSLNRNIKNVVYKRSAPFFKGDRYSPDIFDVVDIFKKSKIIVLFRDPRASTYSTFRRGFVENLRNSAKICEEQLTLLSAKLKILDKNQFTIVNYEKFCHSPQPYLENISNLCNLDFEELSEVSSKLDINSKNLSRWERELSDEDRNFLFEFFNERRRGQFDFLYKNS